MQQISMDVAEQQCYTSVTSRRCAGIGANVTSRHGREWFSETVGSRDFRYTDEEKRIVGGGILSTTKET